MTGRQTNTKSQRNTDKIGIFSLETTTDISDFDKHNPYCYRILAGISSEDTTGYISIDVDWIRLQFKCYSASVYSRVIYGTSNATSWSRIN